MARSYEILFSINLQHDYYAGDMASGITLEPSADCNDLLKQLNMVGSPGTELEFAL